MRDELEELLQLIDNYWFSADIAHTSAFGAGDCMQCAYTPEALEALEAMASGIQVFLEIR